MIYNERMFASFDRRSLFIPSISDLFFLIVFLYLSFSAGQGLLADCDTGYHIRAGEFIIDNFSIPKHDIFSFTSPPLAWTAHEWLSEVIMALIHRQSGLTGIVIFFSFIIALTSYLLFKIMRTFGKNIILCALIVALVTGTSQIHWLARPHIFSLLLLVVWYFLLDTFQYGGKDYLTFLPFLMILWVNLHGGFISGLVLLGIYLLGNLMKEFLFKKEGNGCGKGKTRRLVVIMTACLLASLVNPYHYHILLFPLKLASNRFITGNIMEFLSPSFHESMLFTYLLFIMIAIFAISRMSLNIIELTLILLFTYMALYSIRYIPLFAVISAPILLKQSDAIITKKTGRFIEILKNKSVGLAAADRSAKGYLWPVLAVVVAVCVLNGRIEYAFDKKVKPVDAVEFLRKENLTGNMFNNAEFGDYIIYASWPQYRVFLDGRIDVYGEERLKEYYTVLRIEPGWNKVLSRYDVNWLIDNAGSPLSSLLLERKDWKMIYADKVANIFVRNKPGNRMLIEKYPDVIPVMN